MQCKSQNPRLARTGSFAPLWLGQLQLWWSAVGWQRAVCVCDGTCVRERDWLLLFSLNFPTAANTCFWPLGGRAWERENP